MDKFQQLYLSHEVFLSLLGVIHLEVLANNPENSCFGLFVHAVDFWIDGMAEKFTNTLSEIWNAQLEFDKRKESNLHTFVDHFMNQYDSTGLKGEVIMAEARMVAVVMTVDPKYKY
jgi:hypothetical protein